MVMLIISGLSLTLIVHFSSKVDWRVKGNLLRGKDFSVSENGNCPRCQSNVIVFVILDEYVHNDVNTFILTS